MIKLQLTYNKYLSKIGLSVSSPKPLSELLLLV